MTHRQACPSSHPQPLTVRAQTTQELAYLDDIDANDVPDWERQYRDYMRDSHGELLSSIRDEQQVSDETRSSLEEAIQSFNQNYEPQTTSLVDASTNGSSGDSDDEGEGS